MKKILRDKKAITLIALVITIVVLVILAGVVISMTVGNDGLIAKAIKAANDYKNAQEKEEQKINDLYGELLVATDGSVQIDYEKLEKIINDKVQEKVEAEVQEKVEAEVTNQLANTDTTPIGTIIAYSKNAVPSDKYLKCEGQSLSRTTYAALYSVIGTAFGSNDSSTFKLPDLRGEFLRGTGTNAHSGEGNGSNVGVHQAGTIFPTIQVFNNPSGQARVVGDMKDSTKDQSNNTKNLDYSYRNSGRAWTGGGAAAINTNTTASTYAFTSRPTNTSVQYCIKVK